MPFFIVGLHIVLCFFLILVVLLQPGKGADFGAAMGGTSQDVFGATGSVTLLTKLTAIVAGLFMATSLTMAWFSTNSARGDGALDVDDLVEEAGVGAEATPAGDTASDVLEPTDPAVDVEPADVAGDDDSAEAAPTGDADPDGDSAPPVEPEDSSSAEPVEGDAPTAEPAADEAAPAVEPAADEAAPATDEAAPATDEAAEPAPAGDTE